MEWIRCETAEKFVAVGERLKEEFGTEFGPANIEFVGPGWYLFDFERRKHTCGCCSTTHVTAKTADAVAREIEERIESLSRQMGEASRELLEVREKQEP